MRSALVPVAVCAVAGLVMMPNHPAGRAPSEDAGVFFYVAERLLEGGVPYRDVWDHKPPGIYLIDALGLALGGPLGVWFVQLAALVVAALVSLRALAPLGSRAALFGTFAWLVAVPRLYLEDGRQSSPTEFYAFPLQFAALALYGGGLPHAAARAGAIGALGGLAFLFKPTLGGVWLAIAIVTLVTPRPGRTRWLLALLGGALGVVALVFGLFGVVGALGDLYDQVFRYNSAYASFAGPADRLFAVATGLRLTLPSGLAVLAVIGWLLAVSRIGSAPTVVRVAVVAAPIELALATLGRGYNYYYLPWLASFGVLAAYVANVLAARFRPSVVRVTMVGAALLMALVPAVLILRLTLTHDNGTVRSAAAYVSANTRPGDTVLVWGSRTEVLLLADRLAPSRYIYQYAPLSTRGYATAERVAAFARDLERRLPVLIVDTSSASFVTPPLDRAGLQAYVSPEPQYAVLPEMLGIIDFVEARYQRVGTIPEVGWPVWRVR